MKWIKLLLRLIIGAFFIFSAYSKLNSIEAFEVYLFRSTFFSYDAASVFARLLIGFEFIAALGIIFKLAYSIIWKLTTLFILAMTGFLAWQVAGGDDGNCFCLGEIIEMSPTESLIKNVVLILGLLLVRNEASSLSFRFREALIGLLFSAAIVTPFILSPPDVFVKGQFDPAEHNQQALDEAIKKGDIPSRFIKGRRLLSFYSMKCKYCKMSSSRISALVSKNGIDRSKVNIVFGGLEGNPIEFFEETHSQFFEFSRLHRDPFLSITIGRMPLSLLIEDGKVISEMNYRNIDDKQITDFLSGK